MSSYHWIFLHALNWFILLSYLQAELGRPNSSHPDKGKVSIYVDCSPTAEPTFEVYEISCSYFGP